MALDPRYRIDDTRAIISPGFVIFYELLEQNILEMIRIAGDPSRLRPHCKTHKMREVAQLELRLGITKGKCATLAEAEMLAQAGVLDVFLAYNLVGPNIERAVKFQAAYPNVTLSVTADHAEPLQALSAAMQRSRQTIDVLLDIDTGQHRTGVPAGPEAQRLYQLIADLPGIRPAGLHAYDGQNHQRALAERKAAVMACWEPVAQFRDSLVSAGLSVPKIVAGGTGSFPIFASLTDPALELSPGTVVFHDAGYSDLFPDLHFVPAALVLTRVISRPTDQRVTLDLGYKAIASDPPAGQRLFFPQVPDAKAVLQNEEHLVIETPRAHEFQPGDELLAIPRHVCPTSALHKQAYVIRGGRLAEMWQVVARDRWLTL